jgi:hypothetical protein
MPSNCGNFPEARGAAKVQLLSYENARAWEQAGGCSGRGDASGPQRTPQLSEWVDRAIALAQRKRQEAAIEDDCWELLVCEEEEGSGGWVLVM